MRHYKQIKRKERRKKFNDMPKKIASWGFKFVTDEKFNGVFSETNFYFF